jgi:uncharacterized cupin superfamily protein
MSEPIFFQGLDAPEETGAPRRERVIAGAPTFVTQVAYQSADEAVAAGVWSCSVGAWRIEYDELEYCRILSGRGALVSEDGRRFAIMAGDAFLIPPGFKGVWEVSEPMKKQFVVIAPPAI